MKRKNIIIFYSLITLYIIGIFAGSLWQVHINEQTEMYQYLKNGVNSYNESIKESITAVAKDSIPELSLLFLSAYIPYGIIILYGAVAIRGFMASFAITAALRTFGISGVILCIGNVASMVFTIPCLVFFGIFLHNKDNLPRYKLGLIILLFLLLILLTDCFFKGVLSPVFVRLWAK